MTMTTTAAPLAKHRPAIDFDPPPTYAWVPILMAFLLFGGSA